MFAFSSRGLARGVSPPPRWFLVRWSAHRTVPCAERPSTALLGHVDDRHQTTATLLFGVVVGGVVRDVAVKQPLAGLARLPDDVVALPGPYVNRVRQEPCFLGHDVAVGLHYLERAAV